MILNLDHLAILTADLEATAARLPDWLTVHEQEQHDSEGTLERYACPASDQDPALLLLQAVQPGPYTRALEKRGPGLHHVACSTDALDEAVAHFEGRGLVLHPVSAETRSMGVAWFSRPGLPFLLELFQVPDLARRTPRPTALLLPAARVGELEPVDLVPDLLVASGPGDALVLRIGDDVCELDPWT